MDDDEWAPYQGGEAIGGGRDGYDGDMYEDGGASSSRAPPPAAPEPWKLLGRDNPAGRALFKLYGGDGKGKGIGNQYTAQNRARHEQKLASGWKPPERRPSLPDIQKPSVNYPKFGVRAPSPPPALAYLPHRKPGEMIQKELAADAERMRSERPPMPKGPLLDAKEKQRFAASMQYRGKVPKGITDLNDGIGQRPPEKPRRAPKSKKEELQDMFDEVMKEIEERREFLADLERAGGLKKDHVVQVQTEIKQRIADLNKIDEMLKNL